MIDVSSHAIQPDAPIPSKFTCDGEGISPPLAWSEPPIGTASVAILVDDPDAPNGPFVHWMIADIPPDVQHLEEGGAVPHEAYLGESDAGTASYYGPCPPSGVHHYRFHVYALDTAIGRRLRSREEFLSAIAGHVLDEGELVGTYQRA